MVKRVEGFKRIVSALAKFFMGITMILTMALYSYNIFLINQGHFFITRTRQEVTQTIDFEVVTTNEMMYFLYRNETEGATDANPQNWYIVPNAEETCEEKGY